MLVKLIVGLGNPGKMYTCNRHNIGFRCLNYLASLHSIRFSKRKCQARIGIGELEGHNVLLAKPETFINLSGIAVDCLMDKYRISRNNLLVISDDMNLPLGKIRLRPTGGMGGHNGMRSIISALGGDDFMRIRVGIGHPREGIFGTDRDVIVNYVLSDFLPHEEEMVETIVIRVAEAIDCCLTKGIETAMNRFN
jgi:PTH1 family peptidyl-tRNA hydrolase